MSDAPPVSRAPWVVAALLGFVLLLEVKNSMDGAALRAEVRKASEDVAAAKAAATKAGNQIADIKADLEMLASGMEAAERQIKEIADQQILGGNPFADSQSMTEFTPELRESLRKASAAKGVTLLEDRVVFPARIAQRQGAMEFLAVFPGGKAHESVLILTGEPDAEGNLPSGLGATLNSCLMALGLHPGTPVRYLSGGRTTPATGPTVHVAVEWEEDGKLVRVRGEDLLWDIQRNRPVTPGKWIYSGSFFDPEGQGYVPDLAGAAVACYSVSTTVVDLDDPEAADDQCFVACGPRIPPEGTKVRAVFSPAAIPPTRTFDAADPKSHPGGAEPPAPGPSAPGDGEKETGGGK